MNFMIDAVRIGSEGCTLWKMGIIFKPLFFRLHQNAFFRYNYFNGLLAVCVQAILELAKIFWSRNDEIFHLLWF